MLKNAVLAVALAAAFIPASVSSVIAQTTTTTTARTAAAKSLDMKTAATSYRSTKIVGMPVVNEANETIGTIDDLLITRKDRGLYAIVSVGGFLGIGNKLISVRFQDLKIMNDNALYTGGTKADLEKLPAFTYAK